MLLWVNIPRWSIRSNWFRQHEGPRIEPEIGPVQHPSFTYSPKYPLLDEDSYPPPCNRCSIPLILLSCPFNLHSHLCYLLGSKHCDRDLCISASCQHGNHLSLTSAYSCHYPYGHYGICKRDKHPNVLLVTNTIAYSYDYFISSRLSMPTEILTSNIQRIHPHIW